MANLRYLKKRIDIVCEDLATDALIAQALFPEKINEDSINAIINEIAALQEDTHALVKITFDKGRKEFEHEGAYRRARRTYFKVAYEKLNKEFVDRAIAIVDQLNEVVPEEVRKKVTGAK